MSRVSLAVLTSVFAFSILIACTDRDGPAENFGERVDDAVSDARDRAEDIGDELEEAADEIRDAANDE
jgi:hypothetical protein